MPEKTRLDRLGDWSIETTRTLLRHPAPTIGGVTVVLFVVARGPTQIFYSHFGIRPDEVGFDSVQTLLQGTAIVLAFSLAVGLAYGILMPFMVLVRPMGLRRRQRASQEPKPGNWADYKTAARRSIRAAPILVPTVSIVTATVVLSLGAINDASAIDSGNPPPTKFMPWKAVPAEVIWVDGKREVPLPDCRSLFYLGEGDGRVALYDSVARQTYRIDSGDIQLDFPSGCRIAS